MTPSEANNTAQTTPPSSGKDKQFDACLLLKDISCRQADLHQEIRRFYDIFGASESLNREQKKALSSIKQSIIPFLEKSSKQILEASSKLSPIASANYVHERKEADKRRSAKNEKENNVKNKPSPLKRIDLFNSTREPLQPLQNLPDPCWNAWSGGKKK